jgi:hypothetical protein
VYLPQLILAALFALAGYKEAQRFARQYGRTPWGWQPWGWALALGLSWVVGIVLLAIAERAGRAQAKSGRTVPVMSTGQYLGQTATTNQLTPQFAGTASSTGQPTAGVSPATAPIARWAPDPSGRHQHRWWDGTAWTAHVSTNGITSQDPVR